jgi:hypothetical protein
MGKAISELFFGFSDRSLPSKQVSDYIAYTQHDFYFQLALQKNIRIEQLKDHFSRTKGKVFVSAFMSGLKLKLEGWEVICLEHGFFQSSDNQDIKQKIAYLADSIVIMNSNDINQACLENYVQIYSHCATTIFTVWDWDNHHSQISTFLAAHSDLYLPAHNENLYLLSRYNSLLAGPVFSGTVQWHRKFLTEHLVEMLTTDRTDAPLGKHFLYSQFIVRSRIIVTLNQHFSSIGFCDRNFHTRTEEYRLKEWYSHKSHWIVPILNDVPMRIFDALVTGGIPIVPESLRFVSPIHEISREHIVFYGPQDIVYPHNILAKANELFDMGGKEKLVERHSYALANHHVDAKVHQIVKYINEAFNLDLHD